MAQHPVIRAACRMEDCFLGGGGVKRGVGISTVQKATTAVM